ncbi:hypothetical protein OF387_01500 [Lentilactobacillus hilgardii]|nr:hypothetical protein [Lentilactobacillus hilgardii]MCV3739893.1 hypothetical protein [Lentilactobacillus hilgardii]
MIKKILLAFAAFLILMIGLAVVPGSASASYSQSTFPRWARGTWYSYTPHAKRIHYDKITITAKHVYDHDYYGGRWHRYFNVITRRGFNGELLPKKSVYIASGHRFTAPIAKTTHTRSAMVPEYWHVKKIRVHNHYRKALLSSTGAGWDIGDTYAFRSRVRYQAKFMYTVF